MKRARQTHRSSRSRAAVVVVAAVGVWLAASDAGAQGAQASIADRAVVQTARGGGDQLAAPARTVRLDEIGTSTIRTSLASLRFGVAADGFAANTRANARAEMQRGYRGRHHRGDRGVAGLVLGAIGGFAAGGAIGVAVADNSCHCNDPALHGFVIGAPIGAVIGGFIGYALAR